MKSSEFNKLIEQRRLGSTAHRAPPAARLPAGEPASDSGGAQTPGASSGLNCNSAFYKPRKTPVTIRLDADVLDWFKRHAAHRGYQTEINRVLRLYVTEREKRRADASS